MDLDKALVRSLILEGRSAVLQAKAKGIREEILQGEGRDAFALLLEYIKLYDGVPTEDYIQGRTKIVLEGSGEPSEVLVDTVLGRKLARDLEKGVEGTVEFLRNDKPDEAFEYIDKALKEIRHERISLARIEPLLALGDEVLALYERKERGETGILTPWPLLNEATLGLWPQDVLLVVARTGIGKCLDENSELVDPISGVPRTLREFYTNPGLQHSFTWSRQRGIHSAPITAKVDTGRKVCLKVTFASGRSIIVTPEHPFLTPEGWRPASELRLGSTAALPARMPFPLEPVALLVEEVDLLAVLLAEGSYSGHHTGFTTMDGRVFSLMQDAADAFETDITPRSEIDFDFVRRGPSGSNAVLDLLRKHGMEGKKAVEKVIPEAIFRLPPTQLSRFLGLFWMCDGYVDGSGPQICLASERMVRQLQHLLLRFGIQSSVDYKRATCEGKEFDSWRLRVYASSYDRFAGAVPLWGDKQERLQAFLEKDRNSNVGFPRVSNDFVRRVKEIAAGGAGRRNGSKLSQVRDRLGWSSCFSPKCLFKPKGDDLHSLSLHSFEAFCDVYGCADEFAWLGHPDIFWDVVEDISDAGERKIYDLTMEPTSCFVANDILVHNTWSAVKIAEHARFAQDKRVLFVTTEMSKVYVANRFYAVKLKLPYKQLNSGKLGIFGKETLKKGVADLKGLAGIDIIGGTFDFRVETFAAAVEEARPDLVVLDGAYLLRTDGKTRTEKAANAMDEIKRIAVTYNVPMVVTMQFNREVKTNSKDSASLDKIALTDVGGWNASMVIALTQTEEMKKAKRMIMQQLKVREGEGGSTEVRWDIDTMDFTEIGKVGEGGGGDADEFGTGTPTPAPGAAPDPAATPF